MESREIRRITREVEHYFGFLFDRGFRVVNVHYLPDFSDNWIVTLGSSACLIYVGNDRDRITLDLSPTHKTSPRDKIPLERLISMMSDGRDIVIPFRNSMISGKRAQLERLAQLLQRHIDHITSYFAAGSPIPSGE